MRQAFVIPPLPTGMYTVNSEIFARGLFSRNFMKIKPSQDGEITLLFTGMDKSCISHAFLTWQICLLTLFAKIDFP